VRLAPLRNGSDARNRRVGTCRRKRCTECSHLFKTVNACCAVTYYYCISYAPPGLPIRFSAQSLVLAVLGAKGLSLSHLSVAAAQLPHFSLAPYSFAHSSCRSDSPLHPPKVTHQPALHPKDHSTPSSSSSPLIPPFRTSYFFARPVHYSFLLASFLLFLLLIRRYTGTLRPLLSLTRLPLHPPTIQHSSRSPFRII
jgi:hypothetical protein